MSQYGYGYGASQGYQPPGAYSKAPSATYSAPPYQSTEPAQTQNPGHGSVTLDSYEYNRQTIPGLGLNFSNNATGWQQPWSNGALEHQVEQSQASRNEQISVTGNTARSASDSHARPRAVGQANDAVEEGELSEGELEDIYEPGQVEGSSNGQPRLNTRYLPPGTVLSTSKAAPAQPPAFHAIEKDILTPRYLGKEQAARERSGSYSPYLSPREIGSNDQADQANSPSDAPDTPHSNPNMELPVRSTDVDLSEQEPVFPAKSTHESIQEAKRRAQDAILRLWPLNIRHQNYLDEGIDKQLIDSLFAELGLDSSEAHPVIESPPIPPSTHVEQLSKEPQRMGSDVKDVNSTNGSLDAPEKPKDKSEERKDRIARLLAAKGSKSTVTVPDVSKATVATVAPPTQLTTVPSKKQSEKSKLIQQKMEALRKARAANTNKTPQTEGSTTPTTETNLSKPPALPTAPFFDHPDEILSSAIVTDQPRATLERSESHDAPSIPGLFLSSTPQASAATNQRKRPVAADLNENSISTVSKRPFGQSRESRPFLIDVSDDEDDAEMDIDSPELRPTSIHQPTTPTGRTSSFRDHPALSDDISNRQIASPKHVGTPAGSGGSGNGLYNLENMTKKIEDMKRKIAEAEARKKAKLSSNGTPSVPHSENQSKEGSVDIPSIALPTPGAITPSGTDAEDENTPILQRSQPMQQPSSKLAKIRGQRGHPQSPLRSRIASARLPVLEAHRNEQIRQLKHLQSEVARIEQEIQESLQEEERLREEAMVSESDAESQNGSESEHVPGQSRYPLGPILPPGPKCMMNEFEPSGKLIPLSAESDSGPQPVDPSLGHSTEPRNQVVPTDQEQEQPEISSKEIADPLPEAGRKGEVGVAHGEGIDEKTASTRDTSVVDHSMAPIDEGLTSVDSNSDPGEDARPDNSNSSDVELDSDVAMGEDLDASSDEDTGDSFDGYEPTEAGVDIPNPQTPTRSAAASLPHSAEEAVLETSDTDLQGVSATSPITQPISAADAVSPSVSASSREVDLLHYEELTRTLTLKQIELASELVASGAPKSTFTPYETPLQFFRAYRFHPKFKDSVAGGLRSLTYSNQIDVQREVCPDQLVGGVCPRGKQCEFQHFDNMKAPDDQILVQLGAYGNYEGEQKQKYITGLRELLTGFRNRKIKDFQALSDGIIEYRAQFHGDRTKILPLGSVAI
ncbi:hypothetical protein B0J13DRAFT_520842 [Dactylonectria estremocensis]|uniref:C3H1-type domain-containing protein n=1 Tax=Dactylonectria estremocensis TaxID=1079267 RepID=A0A9P9JFB3_9HYPO|nr:hypothetical protein B0J13DRAFT_520842 [Dactylonectria estremocensis]